MINLELALPRFGGLGVNTEDRGYTYDTAWNLNYRTNNGVLATFKVDPQNQLTNAPGIGRQSYDGNGNLVQGHAAGPDYSYTYDDENRLVAVEREEVWRAEFTYDGQGRLRVRKEYDFTDDWNLTSETHYLYDGMRAIQERDGSNEPTVSYTRGTDLSGRMEGAGGIGGLLARSHGYSSGNWTTHNFYHADGNGKITYLVNSSQTLAASYRYDPFGNTTSSSGALAADNAYRFSSKEVHANSGMYYYGYRFYDPPTQRWLNRDPIEEEGGINLYEFAGSDPANAFDAFGLKKKGGKPKPPPHPPGEWLPDRENCCAYAYDLPGKSLQPGELGNFQPAYPDTYTCDDLKKRVLADFPNNPNVKVVGKRERCAGGYHKIQLWGPKKGEAGYHFTRENDDGSWSDMPYRKGPGSCKPNKSNEGGVTSCDIFICVPNRPLP